MGSQRKMGVTPKVKDLLLLFLHPVAHFLFSSSSFAFGAESGREVFTCAIRSPDRPTDRGSDPNNGLNNNPGFGYPLPNPLLFCFAPEEGRNTENIA